MRSPLVHVNSFAYFNPFTAVIFSRRGGVPLSVFHVNNGNHQIIIEISTDIPYIKQTEIIFIETPEFIKKIDKIAFSEEFYELQDVLIADTQKGKIEKGTGGARKIRLKVGGRGKSGGARIIYYYVDLRGEIQFLEAYLKKDKTSLNEAEKKEALQFY